MVKEIRITNKRIIDFYDKYKTLNIVENNLKLIDICENTINSTNDDINISNKVFDKIDKNETKMDDIYKLLNETNDNMNNKINETNEKFNNEMKKYNDNIRQIIEKNGDNGVIKNEHVFVKTLEQSNSIFLDKLRLHLNEYIPNNQKEQFNVLNKIDLSLREEHCKLINNLKDNSQNDHQCIEKYIGDMEMKLTTIIQSLSEKFCESSIIQSHVIKDLDEYLKKYRTSSNKGNLSEVRLEKILNNLYPTATIKNKTAQTSSGDFIITRDNHDDILIENKNYESSNVRREEINKFISDCKTNNVNGVFLSQTSGIRGKKNYHIDTFNGKIFIYVHHVNYDENRIQLAIDVIDNLSRVYKSYNGNDSNIKITKEQLIEINDEYTKFIENRQALVDVIHDFQSKIMQQIDTLEMPNVKNILCNIDTEQSNSNVCHICKEYSNINKHKFGAHLRWCRKRHDTNQEETQQESSP
jgi:hypothetical protein